MRSSAVRFAVVALTACANPSTTTAPYDEVAQIVGAQLVTPGGAGSLAALRDATAISRGDPPAIELRNFEGVLTSEHGHQSYGYNVRCFDGDDKPVPCSGQTVWASVGSFWGGTLVMPHWTAIVFHHATWRLDWMSDEYAVVTSTNWSSYDVTFDAREPMYVETASETALVWNSQQLSILGGNEQAALVVHEPAADEGTQLTLRARTRFDLPGHAWIELGELGYSLDLVTGEVSLGTTLE